MDTKRRATLEAQPSFVTFDLDPLLNVVWVQRLRDRGLYEKVLIGLVIIASLAGLFTMVQFLLDKSQVIRAGLSAAIACAAGAMAFFIVLSNTPRELFWRALFTFDALMIAAAISGMRFVYVVNFIAKGQTNFEITARCVILNADGALLASIAASTIEAWAFRMPARLRTAVLCIGAIVSAFLYVFHRFVDKETLIEEPVCFQVGACIKPRTDFLSCAMTLAVFLCKMAFASARGRAFMLYRPAFVVADSGI